MNCKNCGTYNDNPQSKFCVKCGNVLNADSLNQINELNQNLNQQQSNQQYMSQPVEPQVQQPIESQVQQSIEPQIQQPVQNQKSSNNKKSINIKIIIIVIIVLIATGGGIFYFTTRGKNSDKPNVENSTNPPKVDEEQSTDTEQNNTTENNSSGQRFININMNATYDENSAFRLNIEEVFLEKETDVMVAGRVCSGKVKVGDTIQVIGVNNEMKTAVVGRIKKNMKNLDEAIFGDSVVIALNGISYEELEYTQVLAAPNSISTAKKFEADIYVLTKEEGGRRTPFFSNYQPDFKFWEDRIPGTITLLDGIERANPGDNIKISVRLLTSVAMEIGTEFYIYDGSRVIVIGKVTKINY